MIAVGDRRKSRVTGGMGWLVLAGAVLVWDALAPETLSAAFRRATDTPGSMAVTVAAWALVTAHLFQVLPSRADPLEIVLAWSWERRHTLCRQPQRFALRFPAR